MKPPKKITKLLDKGFKKWLFKLTGKPEWSMDIYDGYQMADIFILTKAMWVLNNLDNISIRMNERNQYYVTTKKEIYYANQYGLAQEGSLQNLLNYLYKYLVKN